MKISLPIDRMSTAEKIETMELLWDDLCKVPENFQSPEWHSDILKIRDNRVKNGKESPVDWAEAKKRLRDSIE